MKTLFPFGASPLWHARFLGALVGLGGVLLACSSSDDADGSSTTDETPIEEGEAAPPYEGPAKDNLIPKSDAGESFQPGGDDDASVGIYDASTPCCNVAFSLADSSGDETTARLRGDFGPLAGDGVPLTWSAGYWTATACMPVDSYVRYAYWFGKVYEDPSNNGGALVDDNRTNPDDPRINDGNGGLVNTFGPIASCSELDASTGGPDSGTATSSDGIKNGTETDVDCGGGAPTDAPACAVGKACSVAADCASNLCTSKNFCSTAGRLYAGIYAASALQTFASASAMDGTAVVATSTTVADVGGIAVDGPRDIAYVASFSQNVIDVFAPGSMASGSPARTISGITNPWGLFVDATSDRLFATSFADEVDVYDSASTRDGAVAPNRRITALPSSASPYGLAYDAGHNRLFVSLRGSNVIAVFDNASAINGAYSTVLSRSIVGGNTGLASPSQLAYDAGRDELYVSNRDATATGHVLVFASASTANGNVVPSRRIDTPAYSGISGVALDLTRDELYISTASQTKIPVFANASTLVGAVTPSRRLDGLVNFASQLAFDPMRP